MRLILVILFFLLVSAVQTSWAIDFPEGKLQPTIGKIAVLGKPVKGSPLLGKCHSVGFCGTDFRSRYGIFVGVMEGLGTMRSLDGSTWLVHFEAESKPLKSRQIYWAQISGDQSKGCGANLPEYTPVPPKCILHERFLTWEESKIFMRMGLVQPDMWIRELERYLNQ